MRRRCAAVLLTCSIFALAGARSAASADPAAREIDAAKSSAQFSIEHIFVERVTGTVPILSGSVTVPPGASLPTGVTAVLDATRISSGDRDRDRSLESPDYFDTKNFPTWTFTSTKVVSTGPAACGIDGTLTLHGVSVAQHLDVTIRGDEAHPVYHAVGRINRHAFGMKGARLDPVIGDAADVTLDIILK
jgi:polyisoprenoid-binding protein YceI